MKKVADPHGNYNHYLDVIDSVNLDLEFLSEYEIEKAKGYLLEGKRYEIINYGLGNFFKVRKGGGIKTNKYWESLTSDQQQTVRYIFGTAYILKLVGLKREIREELEDSNGDQEDILEYISISHLDDQSLVIKYPEPFGYIDNLNVLVQEALKQDRESYEDINGYPDVYIEAGLEQDSDDDKESDYYEYEEVYSNDETAQYYRSEKEESQAFLYSLWTEYENIVGSIEVLLLDSIEYRPSLQNYIIFLGYINRYEFLIRFLNKNNVNYAYLTGSTKLVIALSKFQILKNELGLDDNSLHKYNIIMGDINDIIQEKKSIELTTYRYKEIIMNEFDKLSKRYNVNSILKEQCKQSIKKSLKHRDIIHNWTFNYLLLGEIYFEKSKIERESLYLSDSVTNYGKSLENELLVKVFTPFLENICSSIDIDDLILKEMSNLKTRKFADLIEYYRKSKVPRFELGTMIFILQIARSKKEIENSILLRRFNDFIQKSEFDALLDKILLDNLDKLRGYRNSATHALGNAKGSIDEKIALECRKEVPKNLDTMLDGQ